MYEDEGGLSFDDFVDVLQPLFKKLQGKSDLSQQDKKHQEKHLKEIFEIFDEDSKILIFLCEAQI